MHLRALDEIKVWVIEIRQEVDGDGTFAPQSLLLLSFLGTLKWLLRDERYEPILEAYPALANEMQRVAAWIDQVPFAEAVEYLNRHWDHVRREPALELAAMTYLRVCSRIEVFAGRAIYEQIAARLKLDAGFLVVILAAACFKAPAIASRVDLGKWDDTQYACMRILDHFAELGDTAWG